MRWLAAGLGWDRGVLGSKLARQPSVQASTSTQNTSTRASAASPAPSSDGVVQGAEATASGAVRLPTPGAGLVLAMVGKGRDDMPAVFYEARQDAKTTVRNHVAKLKAAGNSAASATQDGNRSLASTTLPSRVCSLS